MAVKISNMREGVDLGEMTKEEFDAKMARGIEQSKNGEGIPADEFFSSLREEILKSHN